MSSADETTPVNGKNHLLQDPTARLEALLALTDLVLDDPAAALHRIAGELRDLINVRLCALYAVDGEDLRVLHVCEHGEYLVGLPERRPIKAHAFAGAVLDSGTPLVVPEYGAPMCRWGLGDDESESGYTSALLVPMVADDTLGLIELCDSVERDFAAEMSTALGVARIGARAVATLAERQRLEARERVAAELLELGDFVAHAHSLSELVRPVADSLRLATGAEDCDIWRTVGDRIVCVASIDSRGWDDDVIGNEYDLADYPSYAAAVERGEVRVIASRDDPRLSKVEIDALAKWGFNSNLCMPLLVEGRRLGFIDLYDKRPRDFAEHLDFIENVGRMLSGAFEKSLLLDELAESNRDLEVLLDMQQAMTSSVMFEDALAVMARKAAEALGVADCIIAEYVEEIDSIIPRATYERDPVEGYDETGVPWRLSDRPGDRAILEGGMPVVENISDPKLDEGTRAEMEKWGEMTCLNIPLVFKGATVGLLILVELERERTFDDHDLELAKSIGKQAAVACQNARLYRELRKRSDKDDLTGLANTRRLRERLLEEVARSQRHGLPTSVIALEIDDFRKAVDELGREVSNELLKTVGTALAARLHEHIDVIARPSGGKFLVLVPCASLHGDEDERRDAKASDGLVAHEGGAGGLAERLRQRVEQLTADRHGKKLPRRVTVCAGVASFGGEMRDGDDLQKAAEKALRAAQRAARNSITCAE